MFLSLHYHAKLIIRLHLLCLGLLNLRNRVDFLLFDWNKVNLHSDNVSELSLSLEACLCTLMFQIHSISVK